jgi:hypothetical protein
VKLALSQKNAAAALGIGVDRFKRHVRPRLSPLYIGGATRYRTSELEAYAEQAADRRPREVSPPHASRGARPARGITARATAAGELRYRAEVFDAATRRRSYRTFGTLAEAQAWREL